MSDLEAQVHVLREALQHHYAKCAQSSCVECLRGAEALTDTEATAKAYRAERSNMLAIIRGEMSNHPHDYARGWLARDALAATPPNSDAQVAALREAVEDELQRHWFNGQLDGLYVMEDVLKAFDEALNTESAPPEGEPLNKKGDRSMTAEQALRCQIGSSIIGSECSIHGWKGSRQELTAVCPAALTATPPDSDAQVAPFITGAMFKGAGDVEWARTVGIVAGERDEAVAQVAVLREALVRAAENNHSEGYHEPPTFRQCADPYCSEARALLSNTEGAP